MKYLIHADTVFNYSRQLKSQSKFLLFSILTVSLY